MNLLQKLQALTKPKPQPIGDMPEYGLEVPGLAQTPTKGPNWWSLDEATQNVVKALVPNKDTWVLDCTKQSDGVWVFSLPQFMTFDEALCNGTEKALDWHYNIETGKEAVAGDKMKVTVSSKDLEGAHTTCKFLYADPKWDEASYYLDTVAKMDVWLCPYLQVLFKGVPKTLWLKLEPKV